MDVDVTEHEADEARDRERHKGPVTTAMLHTALMSVAYQPENNPRDQFDLNHLAWIINSWLTPVSS